MITGMPQSKQELRSRIRAARAARAAGAQAARAAGAQQLAEAAALLTTARESGLLGRRGGRIAAPAGLVASDRRDGFDIRDGSDRLVGPAGRVDPVTLAAYVAAPGEPDVGSIRSAVRAAGGTVLLPVPGPGGSLGWAVDEGAYRQHHRLPVPVPTGEPMGSGPEALVAAGTVVVLAPALAVDRTGTRLGQGGGFYDRLLAGLAGRIPVIAVVHDDEVLAAGELPRDQHDWPVDAALTPERLVWFQR